MPVIGVAVIGALSAAACARAPEGPLFNQAPGSPLRAAAGAGPPVAGDLDADGDLDIVVPCAGGDDGGRLVVFLGDGSGDFVRAAIAFPVAGGGLRAALGDVNGDGAADVVVTRHDSYDVMFALGDGRGGFTAAPQLTVALAGGKTPHTHAVTTADVDADGSIDVLATCAEDNAVAVLLGEGDGRFAPAPGSPFPAGRHPYEGLSVADVNGDGHVDFAAPNLHGSAVTVLLGDGTGRFAPAPGSPFAVGPRPGYVAVGDLDDDGAADLVVTHDEDPVVAVLLDGSGGGMAAAPGSPLRLNQPVWSAAIADVDGDGKNDVVLGGRRDRVFVLRGDGAGTLAPPRSHEVPGPPPGYVTLADVDGNGRPDLIVGRFDEDRIDVLLAR